jgi:sialate O-acetylesterase
MRIIIFISSLIPIISSAQLNPAKIFSDNMVLQRDQSIHVWGKGKPGKEVTVILSDLNKTAQINSDSSWSIVLASQKANTNPQSLIIVSVNEKIEFKNILIGDLWLCLGQSNMQWPMKQEMHFKSEFAQATQPLLRFYNPNYAGENIYGSAFPDSVIQRLNANDLYKGSWQVSDSLSFKTMSAVGYYFGKSVVASEQIPLGLVDLSIGGAPIETFINNDAMKGHADFASKVESDWLTNESLPVWIRERGNQNVGSHSKVAHNDQGANHPFKPGFAYAAGIQPLFQFPIKGIIWYQGESNAQEPARVKEYATLAELMVDDYRKGWKQPNLPFYWVQLSSIDTVKYKGHLWPQFREEQRRMLSIIQDGGMAVCSDIGVKNDVHPRNKKYVGERLARWALNKTYHRNIIPSGPLPVNAKHVNGKVIISFRYTGNGLQTTEGNSLQGFSLDGKTDVGAMIKINKVIIAAEEKPAFVYYGWKPFSDGNLVNSELLPASTFKIEVH